MQKAAWRTDLSNESELARRAQTAATEALGFAACSECGQRAAVYLRVEAMRFRAALCDPCCTFRLQFAAIGKATVQLDGVVGAPAVTTIEGIDLAQLAVEVCDCAVGDHSIESVQNVPGAVAAVVAVLAGKLSRALRPSEQLGVVEATRTEVVRRYHAKRAALAESQSRLHNPMARLFVAQRAS